MVYALCSCEYKVENKKPVLYLFARDETLARKIFKVSDFKPYFYIRDSEGTHPIRGIDGYRVMKKETQLPSDVGQQREHFNFTYESDILFPIRFMIDRDIRYGFDIVNGQVVPADCKLNAVLPLFLDIEVETEPNMFPDPEIARWPIIACTVFIPFDGNIAYWRFEIANDDEEREFFETLIKICEEFDPDIITAYNVYFDLCTIIKRMQHFQIPHHNLSPLGRVNVDEHWDRVQIAGRNVFDLYAAYKQYNTGKVLPTYALEPVAFDECDIPESAYPLKEMNRNYLDNVADYNLLDVYRMVALDDKLHLISFYDNLRIVVGCTFDEVFEASRYVDVLLLRYAKGKYILPRKPKGQQRMDYVGAIVLPPKKGFHTNVIFLDFSKMYPSILISYNISPETLRTAKPQEGHYVLPVGLKQVKEDGTKYVEWKETYFLKNPPGLLPEAARDLIKLRNNAIAEMKQHPRESDLYESLWWRQNALKMVLNACYGVFAYPQFRLFVPLISASMTGQGQKLTLRTIEYMKSLGYDALYADTDGLYFITGEDVDPVDKGLELCKQVNEFWEKEKDIFGLYAAPSVKLEYVFDWIILAKKKRYAAIVIYDNGQRTRKEKIVGFEAKRSDSPAFSRVLQRDFFRLIFSHEKKEILRNFLVSATINARQAPLSDVGIPCPIKMAIDARKNVAAVKSVVYSNQFLNQKIGTGSHPLEYYVKTKKLSKEEKKEFGFGTKPLLPWGLPTKFKLKTWSPKAMQYVEKEYIADRIAFNEPPSESWRPFIDMDKMVEKVVWNKVETILSALGWTEEERIALYGSKRPIKKEKEEEEPQDI